MGTEIAAEHSIAPAAQPRAPTRARDRQGYTVLELMLVIALVGVVAGVAIVKYLGYVEKARVARAVAEILSISRSIEALVSDDEAQLPASLAEVGAGHMLDPWGNPYQYLKLFGELPSGMSGRGVELPPVASPGGDQGGSGGGGPPAGGGGGQPAIALARKDRFLVPINSDYDLYSMGADGQSRPQLHSLVSRDDVIRARDGGYVGLAENF